MAVVAVDGGDERARAREGESREGRRGSGESEEHTAALAAEAQSSLSRQSTSSALQSPDTFKRARGNRQIDRLARSELA